VAPPVFKTGLAAIAVAGGFDSLPPPPGRKSAQLQQFFANLSSAHRVLIPGCSRKRFEFQICLKSDRPRPGADWIVAPDVRRVGPRAQDENVCS
jgi:hypothetical protein